MVENAKIVATVAFVNLIGDRVQTLVKADWDALAPLFALPAGLPTDKVPQAQILFLYADFEHDGTVRGTKVGVRQIAESAGAKLLVLANELSDPTLLAAANFAGPKSANLILTNNRNGDGFTRFLSELFKWIAGGKEFLEAYTLIAPHGPQVVSWHPGTLLIADAGRLQFRHRETDGAKMMLLRTMLDVSPGDRSLLTVALQLAGPDEKRLVTAAKSANFRLWSQMTQLGWLVQGPDLVLATANEVEIKNFSITSAGRAALPVFLENFAKFQLQHGEKMSEVYKTVCEPFIKTLREEIIKAGGNSRDIQLLTTVSLAQNIAANFRPEFRLHVADAIASNVKKRLQDGLNANSPPTNPV